MLATGNYLRKFDGKNRLVLPASLRREIARESDEMVLTPGLDGCLYLFPKPEYQRYLETELVGKTDIDNEKRALKRHFASQAFEFALDKIGRILIPQHLKEGAGLAAEVMVVGVVDRVELWHPPVWARYRTRTNELLTRLEGKTGVQ